MGAVGNYEIVSQTETITGGTPAQEIEITPPSGKVILNLVASITEGFANQLGESEYNQFESAIWAWLPNSDGTSAQVYLGNSTNATQSVVWNIQTICADMGC